MKMFSGPVLVLSLLLQAMTDAAMENEVYAGCGFEAVPGQLQALKFCTAYGLCIKMLCGPDRVFSRSHCGCVKAVFLRVQTAQPAYTGSDPRIRAMRVWSQHSSNFDSGIRFGFAPGGGCVINTPLHTLNGTLSLNTSAQSQGSDRVVDNVLIPGQPMETTHPRRGGAPVLFSTPTNTSITVGNNAESSKIMATAGNSTSENTSRNSVPENTTVSSGLEPGLPETLAETPGAADIAEVKNNEKPELPSPRPSVLKGTVTPARPSPAPATSAARRLISATPTPAEAISSLLQRVLLRQSAESSGPFPQRAPPEYKLRASFVPPVAAIVATTAVPQEKLESQIVKQTSVSITGATSAGSSSDLECGAEINITGMSSNNKLTGDGTLRLEHVGVRGVTSNNGSAHFNGQCYIWIPFYETRAGITIIMSFQENVSFKMRQGLVANCGNEATSSFSITFDPASSRITFKALVISTKAIYPLHEVVEVSIPYTPGVSKTLEMQCNGQRLIARVDGHVAGSHITSSELYELSSTTRPLLIGTGCREDETDNFHGDISKFTLYRCVSTGD